MSLTKVTYSMIAGTPINVTDFGADATGSTDSTAAIQAAINYAETFSEGATVLLPSGDFLISNPGLRITNDRISLVGEGKHSTRLIVKSQIPGSIIHIESPNRNVASIARIETSYFSVWCETQQTGGTAFLIRDLQHWVCRDVHLRNVFGGWDCEGLQQTILENTDVFNSRSSVLAGSFYFKLHATSGAAVKNTEIYINNSNWRNVQASPTENTEVGLEIGAVDGLWINGGHYMGCTRLLSIIPDTSTTQLVGIECSNVWFDGYSTNHIYISGNSTGGFGSFKFTGCKGLNATSYSVLVDTTCVNLNYVQFTGCRHISLSGAPFVVYVGAGGFFNFANCLITSSQNMTTSIAAIGFGAAAKKYSVIGGAIGSSGGNFPQGMKINNRPDPDANISSVFFDGVDNELQTPNYYTDGSKITGCTTSRDIATASLVTASSAIITLPAIAEVITLDGSYTSPITDIKEGWDGRQVVMVASSADKTFAHNSGSSGTNIVTNTFSNITITLGRFVIATYRAATGTWYVQS